jgi:hypothetical protein
MVNPKGQCEAWERMTFDAETNEATKCFWCDGKPNCLEASPTEALSDVAWRDLTDKERPRVAPTAAAPPEKAAPCMECHRK